MAARSRLRLSPSARVLAAASSCTAVGVLPQFFVGALAVLMRPELGFSETQLGAALSLFGAVSALGSVRGGQLVERVGPGRAMALVAATSAVALGGIAGLTGSYAHLLGWLALAGLANALRQPATNLAVASGVSTHRQGVAFGIKQSAPAATLLGGLAVPALGLTLGWRWAFAAGALVAAAVAIGVQRLAASATLQRRVPGRVGRLLPQLVVFAFGAGFATFALQSLGAFYVESAVTLGVSEGAAGIWFALGSVAALAGRIFWGWLADRGAGARFPVVAILLASGAVGFALMPYADHLVVRALATLLAFAVAWGWAGLFHFALVRQHPGAPAAATGVVQTGAYAGGVVGPFTFGTLVEQVSYHTAWWATAVALVVSSLLIMVGWRLFTEEPAARL